MTERMIGLIYHNDVTHWPDVHWPDDMVAKLQNEIIDLTVNKMNAENQLRVTRQAMAELKKKYDILFSKAILLRNVAWIAESSSDSPALTDVLTLAKNGDAL